MKEFFNKLEDCKNLKYSWDSYDGELISKEAINSALLYMKFLESLDIKLLSLTPTPNGTICLTHYFGNKQIEWEFDKLGNTGFQFENIFVDKLT